MKRLFGFLFVLLTSGNLLASHISGGDIVYECLGNGQYVITLNLFRDCSGITMSTQETVEFTNTCGQTFTASLPVVPNTQTGNNYTDISMICNQQINNTTCNGGTQPGMQHYIYQDTVTLPPCDTWTFSWDVCCRNGTNNITSSTSQDIYLEATMNSQTAPCNNSPQFTSQPIPYICNGDTYNAWDFFGIVEQDGDNYDVQFISAMDVNGTPLGYVAPWSANTPMTGITLDPVTGDLTIPAGAATGNYVVVVQVNEYDAAGNLIGTVMRDIQLVVMNCSNPPIQWGPNGQSITNFTSATALQTGPTEISICEGQTACFDLEVDNPDPLEDVEMDTTGWYLLIPGYTVTETYPDSVFTICWTPPAGSPAYIALPVAFTDDECPIPSPPLNTQIEFSIWDATVALPVNSTICNGQGVQLTAAGGTIFNWSVVSGDPIVVGTNFSCNPCADPIANPSVTTVYEVVSNLPAGCTIRDTVTVNVVPDFQFSVAQNSAVTCLADSIELYTTVTPPGAYTFQWDPASSFVDPNVANPVFVPTQPGTFDLDVYITSPMGCTDTATAQVTVNPGFSPNLSAVLSSDTILCGDSTNIDIMFGAGIPAVCNFSPVVCGSTLSADVGGTAITGSNTTTNWPAPYGNWYKNAKHQFLFTAAELNAMGFTGGRISEIAWQVLQVNGTSQYNAYTIRIGCTSITNLTTWQTGLTTVFGPTNINVTPGWNTHQFTQGYDWDGTSNIIVEICYDNLSSSYTQNSTTPWTTTTFNSCIYYRSDVTPACPTTNITGTTMNRPVTRFGYCPVDPDPANFTYNWSTTQDMYQIAVDSVDVFPCTPNGPNNTMTYNLVVQDQITGCIDSTTVTVYIEYPCMAPALDSGDVSCYGANDGWVAATPVGYTGPWDMEFYDSTGTLLQSQANMTTADTDTLFNLGPGWYYVHTTDTANCTEIDSIYVNEPDSLIYTISNDSIFCGSAGSVEMSFLVQGGIQPYTYTWDNGVPDTAVYTVLPTADIVYHVFATDANGCITPTDSITLTMPYTTSTSSVDVSCYGLDDGTAQIDIAGTTGPYDVVWKNGVNATVQNDAGVAAGATIASLGPDTYTVEVTDMSGCLQIDTFTIVEPAEIIVFATGDSTVCITGTADLNATSTGGVAPMTYTWDQGVGGGAAPSVNPTGLTTYGVTATDANGCVSSNIAYVTIDLYPALSVVMGPGATICPDADYDLSAVASGGIGSGYDYSWSATNGTSFNGDIITVSPDSGSVTYTVTVTDGCETPAVQGTVVVDVIEDLIVTFSADTNAGCSPFHVAFENTTANVASVYWEFGDGSTSSTLMTGHTYQGQDCYDVTLTVTTPQGCVYSTTYPDYICSYGSPDAHFLGDPEITIEEFTTVNFTNLSSYNDFNHWNFADLGASSDEEPTFHFPEQAGIYPVTLTVTNAFGCQDSITRPIVVSQDVRFFVPNSFTPDEDAHNDVFRIYGTGFDPMNFTCYIYNRWGELIWESHNADVAWDGRDVRGKLMPQGTYVWKIVTKRLDDDSKVERQGHVTLLK